MLTLLRLPDGSVEHHEWAFFAIGVSEMCNGLFAGPNFTGVQCVELYVSQSDLGTRLGELEGEDSWDTPNGQLCEHGKPKGADGRGEGCRRVCCRMLAYAHVCSRMLTYAVLC